MAHRNAAGICEDLAADSAIGGQNHRCKGIERTPKYHKRYTAGDTVVAEPWLRQLLMHLRLNRGQIDQNWQKLTT
jgi:hypothetical protein